MSQLYSTPLRLFAPKTVPLTDRVFKFFHVVIIVSLLLQIAIPFSPVQAKTAAPTQQEPVIPEIPGLGLEAEVERPVVPYPTMNLPRPGLHNQQQNSIQSPRSMPAQDPTAGLNPFVNSPTNQFTTNPLSQLPDFVQQDLEAKRVENAPPPSNPFVLPVTKPADYPANFSRPLPATHQLYLPVINQRAVPSELITPAEGGVVFSPAQDVVVWFAPQAVAENAWGSYQVAKPNYLPPSLVVAGPVFELKVATQQNHTPVTHFPLVFAEVGTVENPEWGIAETQYAVTPTAEVHLSYTNSAIQGLAENRLRLYWQNPQTKAWEALPSIVQAEQNELWATIEHSGRYALLAPAPFSPITIQTPLTGTAGVVLLDPDHGGDDPNGGRVTYPAAYAAFEEEYNLQVAELVRTQLQACGLDVEMTRDGDYYVTLSARTQMINDLQPDAAVTLAFDVVHSYMGDNSVTGTGVAAWVDFSKPVQVTFGQQIMARVNEYTGLRNRGLKNGSWMYVVANVNSEINYDHAELAFMDNWNDRAFMDDPAGMAAIAGGVVAAIIDNLGGTEVCTQPGFELPEPLSAEERARLRNLGYQNYLKYYGDPVASTGNHLQQFTDLYVPSVGGLDVVLQRTYNSFDHREGLFGIGWSSFLDMSLRFARDGSVDVRYFDGSGVYFEGDGETFTAAQGGVFDELTRNGPDFMLTTPDQTAYQFTVFGYYGLLMSITDQYGNTLTIERDAAGLPLSLTDSAGRNYPITLEGKLITSITDPGGRVVQYSYNENFHLLSVTNPNGGVTQFTYDGSDRLQNLTDPDGILYLQNLYDSEDRIIEQIDASGVRSSFTYTDDQMEFTDNLGQVVQATADELQRVTQATDGLGAQETFVYDDEYNLESYTDKRGHTWTFTYDERGNVLSSTDPLGYESSYTYDELNNLTSQTDLGGPNNSPRTTEYLYDELSNLVQINRPDGSHITATYDNFGQLTSLTDPNNHTTTYRYDSEGNLVEVVNPLNETTRYFYDAVGRQTSMIDANGHTASFRYDANSNIVEIVDPRGNSTHFVYDWNDNLTEMMDRLGRTTHYTYDENLKLVSETDPGGHTVSYDYDEMYNRTQMVSPAGHVTLYRYDEAYQLVEIEDALGHVTAFEYDANGNLIQITDALGQKTSYEYDKLNRLEKEINALQGTTTFEYDAVGRQIKMTNARGAETRYTYDVLDRLVQMTDALGGQWVNQYDPAGNLVGQTDANGHGRTMRYNDADRLEQYTDAEGHSTFFTYDQVGNLLTITSALGQLTSYEYDANDNLVLITDALNGRTRFVYDAEEQLTSLTDANNHTTHFAYTQDGLLDTLTEAGGQITHYNYDEEHNLATLTNAKGNVWAYEYNALNQRIQMSDPLGYVTQWGYDALGRLQTMTDANTVVTSYGYDALNRLVQVVQNYRPGDNPDHQTNVTTTYGYDAVGNLTAITDANQEITNFTYDLLNRVTQEVNPIGNTWQYGYDPVGNLTGRLDAKGQLTNYQYNRENHLTHISYPDKSGVSFVYDAVYNQTEMHDSLGLTRNIYDALNRLLSSTNHIGQTVSYTYDPVGNRLSMTYPDGQTVSYTYDETNYQDTVTDPYNNVFEVTRDATHNIVEIAYPNSTTTTYSWDPAERLTSVYNYENNGDLISTFDYLLDPVGNRLRTDGAYVWRNPEELDYTYEYDPLYRLTRSDDSENHFTTYAYDAVGNRTAKVTNDDPTLFREIDVISTTYSYNGANQLLTVTNEVTPPGNPAPGRAGQVAQAIQAFIHEVEAQSGHHIDTFTANVLLAQTEEILYQLNEMPTPKESTVRQWVSELETAVQNAAAEGTINRAGVANSLLVKLGHAHKANERGGTEFLTSFYTYDQNGNRTEFLTPDAGTAQDRDWLRTNYSYDFENRLKHVQEFRDSGGGNWHVLDETKLTFDGYGRVFRRLHDQHIGGGGQKWVDYVYDGLDPIAEYIEPSPRYVNYYRGLGRILSMNDGEGQGLGSLYYYHYDGLGSVSAMTKHHLGQSGHTYRYHDYGIILDVNGKAADASNFTDPHNHYTYTGQEWDEEINLFHFYAREYDPQTGTWLQQDPYRGQLHQPQSIHRYGYVQNNPLTFSDFYGFAPWDDAIIGVQVHVRIQAQYKLQHPNATTVEGRLCKSGEPYCLLRTDIRNNETGDVYEIKPNSVDGRATGPAQLQTYISFLNTIEKQNGSSRYWKQGKYWNPNIAPFYVYYPGGQALITVQTSQNGMIYYDKEKIPNPQPINLPNPNYEPNQKPDPNYQLNNNEEDDSSWWEKPAMIGGGAILIAGGVLVATGTLAEDAATGGVGILDDPATLGFASGLIYQGTQLIFH